MNKQGLFAGALSGLFWALAGVFYAKIQNSFESSIYLIFVLLFCVEFTPLVFILCFKFKQLIFKKTLILPFFAGLLAGPVAMYSYLFAINKIGLSLSASITSLYPIVAFILSFLFLHEKLNKLGIFGMILALFSVFMLFFERTLVSSLGILLACISAVSWGCELVLSSITLKNLPVKAVYLARQIGSSLGYMLLIFTQKITLNPHEFLTFSFFSLLIPLIFFWSASYFLYYFSIAKIGISRAMMLNISYVIWLVLFENALEVRKILLIVLVFVGANLVLFSKEQK